MDSVELLRDARMLIDNGDYAVAKEKLSAVLDVLRENGPEKDTIYALRALSFAVSAGRAFWHPELSTVLEIQREAVERARALGNRRILAGILQDYARTLSVSGELSLSVDALTEALSILEVDGTAGEVAWVAGTISSSLCAANDFVRALPFCERAVALVETGEGGSVYDVVMLAECLRGLGNDDEAYARYEQARSMLPPEKQHVKLGLYVRECMDEIRKKSR